MNAFVHCVCFFYSSIKLGTGTTLLIPVEVEVVPRTGLYVPGHKIDFESGGHLDPPAVRPLHLCSSAKKTVTIEVSIISFPLLGNIFY